VKASSKKKKKPAPIFTQEVKMLVVLGALVAIVMFALVAANQPEEEAVTTVAPSDDRLIRSDSPTLGPEDAPVTIVEFLDPECEACRGMFPAVKELMDEYEGQVRLVVRYFPLHANSALAAAATEAAGEQGKYWEMQEILFEQQTEWGEQRDPQTDKFMEYAEAVGLDMDQFTEDLENESYREKVKRDQEDGFSLGVSGTPTFFVNGQRVRNISPETLEEAIRAELG
jgi:protein-disulfide isomerase